MLPWTPREPLAIADSKNPVLSSQEQASFTNSSFVDDNGVVDLIRRIHICSASKCYISLDLVRLPRH